MLGVGGRRPYQAGSSLPCGAPCSKGAEKGLRGPWGSSCFCLRASHPLPQGPAHFIHLFQPSVFLHPCQCPVLLTHFPLCCSLKPMLHTIEHYPILEKRLQPLLSPRTSPLCGGSTTEKAFMGVECELPELGQESPRSMTGSRVWPSRVLCASTP